LFVTWICSSCERQVMQLNVSAFDARVAALTAQAGDDIIERDRAGNLIVRLLCEYCLEAADREDESEINFSRDPVLH
jgi:hypothetical protein